MARNRVKVEVKGLKEVQLAFKEMDSDLPKALRLNFKKIADRVVSEVRPKFPRISGDAQASVKPRASQRGAGIAFGGARAPHAPWLNFGGTIHPKGTITRERKKPDWYVYRTIIGEREQIKDEAIEAVEDTARDAHLKVTRG